MRAGRIASLITIAALAAACDDLAMDAGSRLVLDPNFQAGNTDGWEAEFADLPAGEDHTHYELAFSVRPLPLPLDTSRGALYVQGHNRSDDLFMFLTREVSGLTPGVTYDVRFEIQLASNAGSGCMGAGGAPGESVYLKAGAVGFAPEVVVEGGWLRVNFDRGNQAVEGAHAKILGDVANGTDRCDDAAPYRLKTLTSAGKSIRATADAQGRLWLVVGTDSGYEGLTALYYPSIRVTLSHP